jgi:hypothetical protein
VHVVTAVKPVHVVTAVKPVHACTVCKNGLTSVSVWFQ